MTIIPPSTPNDLHRRLLSAHQLVLLFLAGPTNLTHLSLVISELLPFLRIPHSAFTSSQSGCFFYFYFKTHTPGTFATLIAHKLVSKLMNLIEDEEQTRFFKIE